MDTIQTILSGRRLKQFFDQRQAFVREEYGINRTELEAILYFSLNPGAAATDLHKEMGLNKGQISKALEHLQRERYMSAEADPSDRRLVHWKLMEKGRRVSDVLQRNREEMLEHLLFGLTEEERRNLSLIFRKIYANIENMVR